MTKEVLTLALEALEGLNNTNSYWWQEVDEQTLKKIEPAITAIKEALAQPEQCQCPDCRVTLHASDCAVHNEPAYPKGACNCGAQPEQEPVAWMDEDGDVLSANIVDGKGLRNIPLYTTPPQRTWVGLTDEDRNDCLVSADPCEALAEPEALQLMEDVESKLKDKNK